MARLKRTRYRVELDDGETDSDVYEIEVILADLLRAELEGPKHGITSAEHQAIHTTVLWLWAASVRTGRFASGFREFRDICTNFEPIRDTGLEVQGVPPTVPAPTGSDLRLRAVSDIPTPPPDGSP